MFKATLLTGIRSNKSNQQYAVLGLRESCEDAAVFQGYSAFAGYEDFKLRNSKILLLQGE